MMRHRFDFLLTDLKKKIIEMGDLVHIAISSPFRA
jgi:hypothetical protein